MHTVVDAINTLEGVVRGREKLITTSGLYYTPSASVDQTLCVIGTALHQHGVTVAELVALGPLKIDYLYERKLSPLPLSLGGMIVYRAAQRTQDGLSGEDRSWGAAFDNAVVAAGRVIDLLPDAALSPALAELAFA